MARTHALKCWPVHFAEVQAGRKPFEIRKADRPFAVGDLLVLQEWCPSNEQYTGRQVLREITYVGRDLPGLQKWHVALGIRELMESDLSDEQLHDMLHVDQSGLADGLESVLRTVSGFQWARESRGCYEWDDDRYRAEMGNMLDAVSRAASLALNRWRNWKRPCCKKAVSCS